MIRLSFTEKRRGISTVLGVLFMVGILFTSIIPFFMYVNQVNSYYDRTVVDMGIADQERGAEALDIFAFPHDSSSGCTSIDVFLMNKGSVSLNVTRIWIVRTDLNSTMVLVFNSTNLSALPLQLQGSAQTTIQGLSVASIITNDTTVDYFNVIVATGRGRQYSSQTNPLHKILGGWETGSEAFQIQVLVVVSSWGSENTYKIQVVGVDEVTSGYNNTIYSPPKMHGDFYTIVPVWQSGSYNVTTYSNSRLLGKTTVLITWNHPTTFVPFYV